LLELEVRGSEVGHRAELMAIDVPDRHSLPELAWINHRFLLREGSLAGVVFLLETTPQAVQ
jgi:hypothetical protein